MLEKTLVSLTRMFRGPMKPRVLAAEDLYGYMQNANPGLAITTYYRNLRTMISAGNFVLIKKNLYANMMAVPRVSANEVAEHLNEGAVVTLHSALTHAGVINNPTNIVTASIPVPKKGWRGGLRTEVSTGVGDFWFFRMPEESVIPDGVDINYVLVPDVSYRMATAEKALMDWIYLSNSGHIKPPNGFSTMPPLDIDLARMNKRTLKILAKAMDMTEPFNDWMEAKKEYDSSPNVQANMNVEFGF